MSISTGLNESLRIRSHLNYWPASSLVLGEKSSDSCAGHVRRLLQRYWKIFRLLTFFFCLPSISVTSYSWDHNMRVFNSYTLRSWKWQGTLLHYILPYTGVWKWRSWVFWASKWKYEAWKQSCSYQITFQENGALWPMKTCECYSGFIDTKHLFLFMLCSFTRCSFCPISQCHPLDHRAEDGPGLTNPCLASGIYPTTDSRTILGNPLNFSAISVSLS